MEVRSHRHQQTLGRRGVPGIGRNQVRLVDQLQASRTAALEARLKRRALRLERQQTELLLVAGSRRLAPGQQPVLETLLAELHQLGDDGSRLLGGKQAERHLQKFEPVFDILKGLRHDVVQDAADAAAAAFFSSTKPMRRGASCSARLGMAINRTLSCDTFWMSFMRRPPSSSPSKVTMSGFQ